MFEWLWRFFAGWCTIAVDAECRSLLFALLYKEEIGFFGEKNKKDRTYVRILNKDKRKWHVAADEACLCYTMEKEGGLPKIVWFLGQRPGVGLGLLILISWCLYSQKIIWNFEIDGNENLSDAYIIEELTSLGCGLGTYYPGVDFDALHANVRAVDPEIAWLSVYMNGTTAQVQLREVKHGEANTAPQGVYANVVASEAGEILRTEVVEGTAVVKSGDVVTAGEILISGVVPMKEEGQARLEYAEGRVLAKVACPISVEIETVTEEKVYTGRVKQEKTIKIFQNSINLLKNTGIMYASYDTINKMEQVCLFDRLPIPVFVYTTEYKEYEMQTLTLSPEEASRKAGLLLRQELDKEIENGELLGQTITTSVTDTGNYRIDCLLYLLRDIGKTVEFSVSEDHNVYSDEKGTS